MAVFGRLAGPEMTLFTVTLVPMSYRTVTRKLRKWWPNVVHEIDRPQWSGAHYADAAKAWELLKALEAIR